MNPSRLQVVALPVSEGRFAAHFGQASGFVVFDLDRVHRKVVGRRDLPLDGQHACGFAPFLREHGVETLIVGGIGGGAIANLRAAGIAVCAGAPAGDIGAQVLAFLNGQAQPAVSTCRHDHAHETASHGDCHCHAKNTTH